MQHAELRGIPKYLTKSKGRKQTVLLLLLLLKKKTSPIEGLGGELFAFHDLLRPLTAKGMSKGAPLMLLAHSFSVRDTCYK